MRIIPAKYRCEICGNDYNNEKSALECEAKPKISYPIGLIYGDHSKGAFYKDTTFAVAENYFDGHSNEGVSWACSENFAGDSLGKNRCGSGSLFLGKHNGNLDFEHPTFKRMVEYLKSENIPILIWNGTEAIPYKEV